MDFFSSFNGFDAKVSTVKKLSSKGHILYIFYCLCSSEGLNPAAAAAALGQYREVKEGVCVRVLHRTGLLAGVPSQ